MGKYVVLADCIPDEVQTFVDGLEYKGQKFQIDSYISNWRRTGILSELKRYATYFSVGFQYFLKRRQYDAIVGWQQFYALIFCFFCGLFRVKKTTMVIAFNYTYKEKKGKVASIYRWFMEKCMDGDYLDYIHVPSREYAAVVAEQFHFPRERIIVMGFGVNDCYAEFSALSVPPSCQKDGYALAIGRSNRDYDFLIRAWEGIEYPLVIISDTYKGSAQNDNVVILRNVAGKESHPWIANCGLMVIPIDDASICSGDTVLLTAMAAKRKIIVTAPSTLAEMYVVDGKNAVLAPKKDAAFRRIVTEVLYGEKFADLGNGARQSFLQSHSRQSMGSNLTKAIRAGTGDHL